MREIFISIELSYRTQMGQGIVISTKDNVITIIQGKSLENHRFCIFNDNNYLKLPNQAVKLYNFFGTLSYT